MNISSVSNWNSYVGSNTSQNYNLTSSIRFTNGFANMNGSINLQIGRTFDGRNNTIFLDNFSDFAGLFNLNSANSSSTIRNLKVVCMNVTVSDYNGILVRGSSNNSIISNGRFENIQVIFRSGSFGIGCGGIIGGSSKNITMINCGFDCKSSGVFTSVDGGGLLGQFAGTSSTIDIYDSWTKGDIANNTGGLIGNNSTINSLINSYLLGSATNNNGISLSGTTITTLDNVFNPSTGNTETVNATVLPNINILDNINLSSGRAYNINNQLVLSATTLGPSVINSNLTSVGSLNFLNVSGNARLQGNINVSNLIINRISKGNNYFDINNTYLENTINFGNAIIGNTTMGGNVNNLFDSNVSTSIVSNNIISQYYYLFDKVNFLSDPTFYSVKALMGSGATYGAYITSASTSHNISNNNVYLSFGPQRAFDGNASTFWSSYNNVYSAASPSVYSATSVGHSFNQTTYDITGNAYVGDWIQMEMPTSIILSNVQITPQNTITAPRTFFIFGSNNGLDFTNIHFNASTTNWVTGTMQTFNITTTNSYNTFRMVITSVGNTTHTGTRAAEIRQLNFNSSTQVFPPSNFSSAMNPPELYVDVFYNSRNERVRVGASTAHYNNNTGYNLWLYGPHRILNIVGESYASEVRYLQSSTNAGDYANVNPFTTNNITGYSSSSYSGEYIQFDLSEQKIVNGFQIYGWNTYQSPRTFIFLGSNDDVNWNYLYHNDSVTDWAISVQKTFTFNNTVGYKYYRLVVNKIGNSATTNHPDTQIFRINTMHLLTNKPYSYQTISETVSYHDVDNTLQSITGESVEIQSNSSTLSGFTITPNIDPDYYTYKSTLGEWIQVYKSDSPVVVTGVTLYSRSGITDVNPKQFTILGSNDGINWFFIYNYNPPSTNPFIYGYPFTVTFPNTKAYTNIRFVVNSIFSWSSTVYTNIMYISYTLSDGSRFPSIEPTDPTYTNIGSAVPNTTTYGIYDPCIISYGGNIYYFFGDLKATGARFATPSGTWTPLTSAPAGRSGAAHTLVDDKIYFINGWSAFNTWVTTFYMYNITSNTWTTLSNTTFSLLRACAFTYQNSIYLLGGIKSNNTFNTTMYKYTITDNSTGAGSWSTIMELPFSASGNAISSEFNNPTLYNDTIYCFGMGSSANQVWAYNIPNNQWIQKKNISSIITSSSFSSKTVLHNNMIYLMNNPTLALSGYTSSTSTIYIYSPIHDTMTLVGTQTIHNYNAWLVSHSGSVFAFGGYNGANQNRIDQFTHTTNNNFFMASESTYEQNGWRVHKAFDSTLTDPSGWVSTDGAYNTNGTYNSYISTSYAINPVSCIKDIYLLGKNINGNYKLIGKYNNPIDWTNSSNWSITSTTLPVNINNDNVFDFYKFVFTINNDNSYFLNNYTFNNRKALELLNLSLIYSSEKQQYLNIQGNVQIRGDKNLLINHNNSNVNIITTNSSGTTLSGFIMSNIGLEGDLSIITSNGSALNTVVDISYGNIIMNNSQLNSNNAINFNSASINMPYYINLKKHAWVAKRLGAFTIPSNNLLSIFNGTATVVNNQFTGSSSLYGWQSGTGNNLPGGAYFASVSGYYHIQSFIRCDGTNLGLIPRKGKNINSYVNVFDNDEDGAGCLFSSRDNLTPTPRSCTSISTLVYLQQGEGIWISSTTTSSSISEFQFTGFLVSL